MEIQMNNEYNSDEYQLLFKEIANRIEQAKNNVALIKEKALLELYWNLGHTLLEMGDISESELENLRDQINKELRNDPLLRYEGTNTGWLKLAKIWVKEHSKHDKDVILSGFVTWIQWALLLDFVKSAPQRYWLACQTIKQQWDTIAVLRAAQALPEEYLNQA